MRNLAFELAHLGSKFELVLAVPKNSDLNYHRQSKPFLNSTRAAVKRAS